MLITKKNDAGGRIPGKGILKRKYLFYRFDYIILPDEKKDISQLTRTLGNYEDYISRRREGC